MNTFFVHKIVGVNNKHAEDIEEIMQTMNCILTGKPVDYNETENHYYYKLTSAGNEVEIFVCSNCKNNLNINVPSYIFEGLIANKKWPKRSEIVSADCTLTEKITNGETIILPDFLRSAEYPKTPKEKLEHLFLSLFNMQTFDGELFKLDVFKNDFLLKNYFRNLQEGVFYLKGLKEQGLIQFHSRMHDDSLSTIAITHLGLNKSIELTEEGDKSNKCFIAMSFHPSTKKAREAIREALNKTNYEAIIIDEQIIDSERTINDEIIASLKRCKFCVADFSLHSKGVYFESGFALGQGKKVIYICSKTEFDKAHFDIKPLQHIIYETTEQLTQDLVNKIEAFIN